MEIKKKKKKEEKLEQRGKKKAGQDNSSEKHYNTGEVVFLFFLMVREEIGHPFIYLLTLINTWFLLIRSNRKKEKASGENKKFQFVC